MPFEGACSLIESVLHGSTRRDMVAEAATAKDFGKALARLRDVLRANVSPALDQAVRTYDKATRVDGFHALHDWDGIADKVNVDTIPVDVLHYLIEHRGGEATDTTALAILLDYHVMHLLGLLSLRAWDEGDAGGNLDRLNGLLARLQGPGGSGQRFADNAETLLLIATSHYELHEWGYDKLLQKVKTLPPAHQIRIALGHATSMGCHLRFGFEATYARDTVNMRKDNEADYPWLCFALATLMREYARRRAEGGDSGERRAVVEALANGLSADARAFVGEPPRSLSACEVERAGFRDLFLQHRDDLLPELEQFRPADKTYSPVSFFFNFSHNVLKGAVVDALLCGEPWEVTLDDLLTEGRQGDPNADMKLALATTLMGYARANPHKIRGKLMPVIVYDPQKGHQAFAVMMRKLRE